MSLKYDIYLDTSVINFLFADDAPEKKSITEDFFENFVKTEKYNTFISSFVLEEINKTADELKKKRLLSAIKSYPIQVVQVSGTEVEELSREYIRTGVVPPKKTYDALHIAVSTVYHIHFLVSWNYKHLANINREQRVRQVNISNHYFHELRIVTPLELIDYEL